MTAPVCRWCGKAHSIADCPRVIAALGEDTTARPVRRTVKPYTPLPKMRYCRRCNKPMENCTSANQKYHPACSKEWALERDRLRQRAGHVSQRREIACAWCGQPLQSQGAHHKYHVACGQEAHRARVAAAKRDRQQQETA